MSEGAGDAEIAALAARAMDRALRYSLEMGLRPVELPPRQTETLQAILRAGVKAGMMETLDWVFSKGVTIPKGPTPSIDPPGRARITTCPDCKGEPGRKCWDCSGTGVLLWHACPKCGDPGFDYVNGRNDRNGMVCAISCQYRWTSDDPGWRAQVLPGSSG